MFRTSFFLFNSIIHGNTTTINYLRRSNILLFSNQTFFYHVYQGMYLLFFGYPVITSCSVLLVHLIMFSICSIELVHTNPSNASHSSNTHVSSNSTMQKMAPLNNHNNSAKIMSACSFLFSISFILSSINLFH